MAAINTKWPYNIPSFSFQDIPQFTQICIFCLKTYHLATLRGLADVLTGSKTQLANKCF
jgi:hypothetical protein